MKELRMIEDGLDSADFFLNVNVTQTEEDKFFEELLSLKQKIHVAIEKQEEIEHVKDLMKMNELNFLSNAISLDKYLDEKNLMSERIKEIKKEVKQ
jgi:hypothetical protein